MKTIKGFLKEIGVKSIGRVLGREYEVSKLVWDSQGCPNAVSFRVEGSSLPCIANMIDTREKLYRALGVGGDEEAYRAVLDAMRRAGGLKKVGAPKLVAVNRGLLGLPAIKSYENEAGLYISSAIFVACYEGLCNASIHRVLVTGEMEARVRIVPRHLWSLYRRALKREGRLPVTLVIGVHPAVLLASASSPPLGVFELGVASSLVGGLEVYESPVHGNPVPLDAGVVIEAYLTGETGEEGPYVDALLTYDRPRRQPVMKVEGVYANEDGYFHVIVGGSLEHAMLMGFPREAAIWDSVSRVVPRVYKVRLTPASGGWLHAVISIEKAHDGDGKNAIMAAFAGHPSLKHVVVVDGDVDPDDPWDVEWAIATRFQADRDLVVIRNARGSTLDPSGSDGLIAKMGLDATKPLDGGLIYAKARIPGYRITRVKGKCG